jgi:glycosyltransferase involved in cell wall biosynthesis
VTRALFTSLSGVDPGVFESQVLDYGRFLESLGVKFQYLLFEGFRTWRNSRGQMEALLRIYRKQFDAQIRMRYLLRPLSRRGLHRAAAWISKEAIGLGSETERVLIQARGVSAAWAALEARRRLRSAVVLYDARDDPAAEARMEARHQDNFRERRRWEMRADFLEELEIRVCRESDHILAVSGPLRERVCEIGNRPSSSVTVVPCCLDPHRFAGAMATRTEMRERLGVAENPVLVYAGSLSVWQVPQRMAALVEEVQKRLPGACFLLLTRDRHLADKYFADLERRGSCKVVECGHDEVGRYLAASDIALLLREDDAVNRVACPVKFAEYQSCGLPVVLTQGIGDVSEYVRKTGHGRIVRLEDPVTIQAEEVVSFIRGGGGSTARDDIARMALELYSRDSYRVPYREVLERLGFGGQPGDTGSTGSVSAAGRPREARD